MVCNCCSCCIQKKLELLQEEINLLKNHFIQDNENTSDNNSVIKLFINEIESGGITFGLDEVDKKHRIGINSLFSKYKDWCNHTGERCLKQRNLKNCLIQNG